MIRVLAAGDHTQAAGVTGERIEIESDFDREELAPIAVRMPARIAAIVISIAAAVVEILAQHPADQAQNTGIIQQGAELLRAFDGAAEHGAFRPIVLLAAPNRLDGCLELLRDPGDLIRREERRAGEITECAKKTDLRLTQLHRNSPRRERNARLSYSALLSAERPGQGLGGDVAMSTTRVSEPVFSMPCSHQGGR